ncbi:MAG: peptidoglycan DD-metalloendopeptidase family protein [Anaerolineae bacterium]|nr:peptidoglycan DD-metalloendopeptidase family protein [Anaerolineae bacterium]
MKFKNLKFLIVLWLVFEWLVPVPARATPARVDIEPPEQIYVVQPGDTLLALAERFGTPVDVLMRRNNIADPRRIYPGQQLQIDVTTARYTVGLGENLTLLSRRGDDTWETLAAHNRILNPDALLVGQTLYLATEIATARLSTETLPLLAALRQNIPYWDIVTLNPSPFETTMGLLLPETPTATVVQPGTVELPAPLTSLTLTPQPVMRGQSVIVIAETTVTGTCTSTFLERVVPCYSAVTTTGDPPRLFALLSVPPLQDPGTYEVTLDVVAGDASATVTLPVIVTPGRYDYERLDLPPDRQTLLDPSLSQEEANKIAALRSVRTRERYWEFPLAFPVEGAVTSYFGSRRSYGAGFNSFHAGTDFRGETGTPVLAVASGVVVLADPLVVRGNAIMIDHGWGILTGYWHLSRIQVEIGQFVTQGDVIGRLGNTGLSTGPHLHWELWVNGQAANPLQWTTPFVEFDKE